MYKKFFKHFLFLAICSIAFCSCKDKKDDVPEVAPFIVVNGSASAEHTFPGLFKDGKGIDYKQTFKIKSNVSWTLSGMVDWLNVSPTSGNGEIDLVIYPTKENSTDEERIATIMLTCSDVDVALPIKIIQNAGKPKCYVTPANQVALYDRFTWNIEATPNVYEFQWIILSEYELNRTSDKDLVERISKTEKYKIADDYIFFTGYDSDGEELLSNTAYYFISLAVNKDGEYGTLRKTLWRTQPYYDEDEDAYVQFYNFINTSNSFEFLAKKAGRCSTYHIIYGCADQYRNSAVFAFQINYYLKNKKKHWLAKNEIWEWDIITNYPNDHTFIHTNSLMSVYFPICFAAGWGIFPDGKLSSDLLSFQVDINSNYTQQLKVSRSSEANIPNNCVIRRSEVIDSAIK